MYITDSHTPKPLAFAMHFCIMPACCTCTVNQEHRERTQSNHKSTTASLSAMLAVLGVATGCTSAGWTGRLQLGSHN